MGMIKEFREFALKGNMVDMAVGIVVGGAIGKLVGDMVENLINPIVVRAPTLILLRRKQCSSPSLSPRFVVYPRSNPEACMAATT